MVPAGNVVGVGCGLDTRVEVGDGSALEGFGEVLAMQEASEKSRNPTQNTRSACLMLFLLKRSFILRTRSVPKKKLLISCTTVSSNYLTAEQLSIKLCYSGSANN